MVNDLSSSTAKCDAHKIRPLRVLIKSLQLAAFHYIHSAFYPHSAECNCAMSIHYVFILCTTIHKTKRKKTYLIFLSIQRMRSIILLTLTQNKIVLRTFVIKIIFFLFSFLRLFFAYYATYIQLKLDFYMLP